MNSEKKIKITYLLEYPLDLPGGAQMSTESLCRGLAETEGYEPVVICPELLKKSAGDYPFRILTYPMKEGRIKNLFLRAKAFRKLIAEEGPDIVHIQMPESLITYGICGMKPAKKGGPKLIFTDRGLFYGYRFHSRLLMLWALRNAQLLLTTTLYNRRLWHKGSNIRPIEKIANTISESFGEYEPEKRAEHERKEGDLLCIGLAGRICEEKDWPFACDLIEALAREGLEFRVKLVLSVFEEGDDEKVKNILSRIRAAIGEERLEFHQDLSQSQMQEYYYGVDVFLMTSCFESFGKAAVEAMSRGCSVISTKAGGLPEVIGREENLYTKEHMEKAIEYLKRAAGDREFLKSEQEYFYNRYRECFSQEKCLRDHIEVYERILK